MNTNNSNYITEYDESKPEWYTRTKPDDLQGLIIDEQTGRNIAVSYNPKDAYLIATAPELLDALKQIIEDYYDHRRGLVTQASINKAERAISKARGD